MKQYNIINNSLGWLCFVIAAVTYILTLEPTASFWDCPEFIAQGAKLEVGHPPGNPIFMLTARFFVNFAFGDMSKVALCVNIMSALLSAGTILLLFWTVTHLVKKLIVKDDATEMSVEEMIAVFGSGICGALVYAWSDTFWFSAVEGEVYAFSSFCTALVFWLILKWENRADNPGSDRYLILIAYIIGLSIGVHLLNLLCIPAIVLVFYYRKAKNSNVSGSLFALAISVVIVALILFGLVPGFVKVAGWTELFFVNTLGFSYNIGVLAYTILFIACAVWSICTLYKGKSVNGIRWSVLLTVFLSGMVFMTDSVLVWIVLIAALVGYLWFAKRLNHRVLSIAVLSIAVIFAGYSSYALLLIRSNANPPMNQNAPDNVFNLSSYLNREQYGDTPLLYGEQFTSSPVYQIDGMGQPTPMVDKGHALYSKLAKTDSLQKDEYVTIGNKESYKFTPNTLFPRMHSRQGGHPQAYLEWIGINQSDMNVVEISPYRDENGDPLVSGGRPITTQIYTPSFGQNFQYFVTYQLIHMYWRYFMWNFAGRQNDLQGNGEPNRGNWISGIPFIDNARLGDQSLLPADQGSGNAGHNVFYMLPLILGIIGLLFQAFYSKRGIEQFWVVFFLFFMTGIAIVLYLNQPPLQPRERDYAFAGSFYAFAIWIGMGVAALAYLIKEGMKQFGSKKKETNNSLVPAIAASVIGILVPLQMVSQTWDDHDRSGRYTARDFGMNYLSSLAPNAIIFTNGDNDTFPLWYAQEVEGYRPDVRVVNLSYLTTDWYADQMKLPTDSAAGIDMLAPSSAYAYGKMQYNYYDSDSLALPVNALASLANLYQNGREGDLSVWKNTKMFIPVDTEAAVKAGIISGSEAAAAEDAIMIDLENDPIRPGARGGYLSQVLSLDMLATSAKNGWNRPVYFAMTVPDEYYLGLSPYLRNTGLAYQVSPIMNESGVTGVATDVMYDNVMNKFRWGGLADALAGGKKVYLDETVSRMVVTHRSALLDLAMSLYNEGVDAKYGNTSDGDSINKANLPFAEDRYNKALDILNLMEEKLPVEVSPYGIQIGQQLATVYIKLGSELDKQELKEKGLSILRNEIMRYAEYDRYVNSLRREPHRYNNLSRSDRFTPHYLVTLIQDYYSNGGDIEKLSADLSNAGFDVSRIGTAND